MIIILYQWLIKNEYILKLEYALNAHLARIIGVIETIANDIIEYTATNIISITDR